MELGLKRWFYLLLTFCYWLYLPQSAISAPEPHKQYIPGDRFDFRSYNNSTTNVVESETTTQQMRWHKEHLYLCVPNIKDQPPWDQDGTLPDLAVCVYNMDRVYPSKPSTVYCPTGRSNQGGLLGGFKVPMHARDSTAAHYVIRVPNESKVGVIVYDWDPGGTDSGKAPFQTVFGSRMLGQYMASGRCERDKICNIPLSSFKPLVNVFISTDKSVDLETLCQLEKYPQFPKLSIKKIWSGQLSSQIGRKTNYLPDGAGNMGNVHNLLMIGPNSKARYRIGIEIELTEPYKDPQGILLVDLKPAGVTDYNVSNVQVKLTPEDKSGKRYVAEILTEKNNVVDWNTQYRIFAGWDLDGDKKLSVSEVVTQSSGKIILVSETAVTLAKVQFSTLYGTCKTGCLIAGCYELCDYGLRFMESFTHDIPIPDTTASEINISPSIGGKCVNKPCSFVKGGNCTNATLCLDHNIGVAWKDNGDGIINEYQFSKTSSLTKSVLGSQALVEIVSGLLRKLNSSVVKDFGCAKILQKTYNITDRRFIEFNPLEGSPDSALFFVFGKAEVSLSIDAAFTLFQNKIKLDSVVVSGSLIDLYDWNQVLDGAQASMQAIYTKSGDTGHVFRVALPFEDRFRRFEKTYIHDLSRALEKLGSCI